MQRDIQKCCLLLASERNENLHKCRLLACFPGPFPSDAGALENGGVHGRNSSATTQGGGVSGAPRLRDEPWPCGSRGLCPGTPGWFGLREKQKAAHLGRRGVLTPHPAPSTQSLGPPQTPRRYRSGQGGPGLRWVQ